ncbi:hypothetical protein NUW58_g9345 [Xylaria curta]|uniref:Uncharacterized protein n=1 Tax=Xylaria curta TaxID=42375 RepID=A0ACC1MYT9_9PEZI|nr:hypothetical protein NUW58_g9345 [Xylaria curta]
MWTSEVFSMNVRAQAVGMCSQSQNVANTIFQQFFPIFLANEGLKCLFFFFAANILLALFVFFFIPETKQVRLEEMDTLFGGQNHVEKGGQMLDAAEVPHGEGNTEKNSAFHYESKREISPA